MSPDPTDNPSGSSTALDTWWPLTDRPDLRDALVAAYSSDGRGYHDLRHLGEVLDRLDELTATLTGEAADLDVDTDADLAADLVTLRLAAWFHDAVYDADPDPEGRSAAWAERALADRPERDEVVRLVLLTRDHDPEPGDRLGEALCDADLAILAAPAARYDDYAAGVRREYAAVPDDLFRAGRAEVLRRLVERPSLFRTAYARAHWDAQARANVARELARLDRP